MIERNYLNGKQKLALADWVRNVPTKYPQITSREVLLEYANKDLGFEITIGNLSNMLKIAGIDVRSRSIQNDEQIAALDKWLQDRAHILAKKYVNRAKLADEAESDLGFRVTPANVKSAFERTGVVMKSGRGRHPRRSSSNGSSNVAEILERLDRIEKSLLAFMKEVGCKR